MTDCPHCGFMNGEMEDVCSRCSKSLLTRSRSRERRERERKETGKEMEKEKATQSASDWNELLSQLGSRAEARDNKMKEDMAKILDDNDEKWRKRLDEDRKELLRIQDEKADVKLKASEQRTAAEFKKLRAEIAQAGRVDLQNVRAARPSAPSSISAPRSVSVGARPRFVPLKVVVQGFYDFEKGIGALNEIDPDTWGKQLLDAVPEHIRSKFMLDKSYPKTRRLVFSNAEGGEICWEFREHLMNAISSNEMKSNQKDLESASG